MNKPDWAHVAATAIEALAAEKSSDDDTPSVDAIVGIIEKNCPFKRGVLYEPVPRCDSCRWWIVPASEGERSPCGHPRRKMHTGPAVYDRGLIWTEPDEGCVQYEAKA